jgi:hypothetical protein
VFSVEPIKFMVAMITTEIPAARRPYSIAVAPDQTGVKQTSRDNFVERRELLRSF